MRLSEIHARNSGQSFIISRLEGDALVVERLTEMGLEPGLQLEIQGRLPFGGPILIRSSSLSLALRTDEAAAILLDPLMESEVRA